MKPLSATPAMTEAPRQCTHDEISQRARELWESFGCPTGRDEEIWLEAERQLLSSTATTPVEPTMEPQDATPPTAKPKAAKKPAQSRSTRTRAAK